MGQALTDQDARALDLLLDKVYRDGGYDFRDYKRSTVVRRLERRLHATGSGTYLDYMQFLDSHPEEYQGLADALTITVSGFFRSPYAFQQVAKLVLPELVSHKSRQGKRSLRFWSTACARGEEPYSIAILLAEFLANRCQDFDISILATDISRPALGEAQAGVYSPGCVEPLAFNVLGKYFTRCDQGYAARADIKRMLHFSYFDLTSTTQPPVAELDCVFCCNVLIYLQTQLQEKVLGMLYHSLASPGYLILGEAELPTGSLRQQLECLDIKAKIYKKSYAGD